MNWKTIKYTFVGVCEIWMFTVPVCMLLAGTWVFVKHHEFFVNNNGFAWFAGVMWVCLSLWVGYILGKIHHDHYEDMRREFWKW